MEEKKRKEGRKRRKKEEGENGRLELETRVIRKKTN